MDLKFNLEDPPLQVPLESLTNADCPFTITLVDAQTNLAANKTLYKLTQPVFLQSSDNPFSYSVAKPGQLEIAATDKGELGVYSLQIAVSNSTEIAATYSFDVTIAGCNAIQETAFEKAKLLYTLGQGVAHVTMAIKKPSCTESLYEMKVVKSPVDRKLVQFVEL